MIPLRDENPTHRRPVVTVSILVACVAIFLFVQPSATRSVVAELETADIVEEIEFSYEYAAIPCELMQGRSLAVAEIQATVGGGDVDACNTALVDPVAGFPDKSVWLSVLISMFLHGGWLHLAGNMLFLWVFGNNIEDHLGHVRYAVFYVAAGAVATAAHVAVQLDSTIPLVGASGAIAGVMGAYLVWFPWARVRTFILFGIIPLWPRIPAALVLGFWFVLQFWTDPDAGVAWAAHVGGFVFGVLIGFVARSSPRFRRDLQRQRVRATGLAR